MKSSRHNPALKDGDLVAAVDLGSNSFHMVVARHVLGQLRIIDRIKEHVMLADGLDADRNLNPKSAKRAIDCLALFGQRLAYVKPVNVRVVATNTIRTMVNPEDFLAKAEAAIGHRIEIIAGREEARLIYLGVAHDKPPKKGKRLVIDIGGGSTEFVIGRGFDIIERESLQVGCIANLHRFFPDGKWNARKWQKAKTHIGVDMQPFVRAYRAQGWKEVYGASGTIKALSDIAKHQGISDGTLTLKTLQLLRQELIDFGSTQNIRWPQISVSRRHSIAGGLLTLETAFEELGIARMQTSDYALREGALYDILGRNKDHDPRLDSVKALQERYSIDSAQAQRVETYAMILFDQARRFWDLDAVDREALAWACKLHEIGLAVAHSQHHHHGSYLIDHSDISGFSRTEQHLIAVMIRNQRRSINFKSLMTLNEARAIRALRCILLLRLSVLLYRSHSADSIPKLKLSVVRSRLQLTIPRKWLDKHPLTRSDLDNEIAYLKAADISLAINEK